MSEIKGIHYPAFTQDDLQIIDQHTVFDQPFHPHHLEHHFKQQNPASTQTGHLPHF
mgnify:CR=1 FL=1